MIAAAHLLDLVLQSSGEQPFYIGYLALIAAAGFYVLMGSIIRIARIPGELVERRPQDWELM
jgi:hypothetical protein